MMSRKNLSASWELGLTIGFASIHLVNLSTMLRPDHVEALDREQPCEGDGLERLHWQVGLPGVELAPFACADDFFRVA
jgi:hypothetical protein